MLKNEERVLIFALGKYLCCHCWKAFKREHFSQKLFGNRLTVEGCWTIFCNKKNGL